MEEQSPIVIEKEPWYLELVDECKALVTEAVFTSRWALVEGYWNLGRTISTNDNFQKYAKDNRKSLQLIAKNLNMSERTLYYAMQVFEKYPRLETLPEGKNISWGKLVNKYLPRPKQEKEIIPLPEGEFNVIYADPPWQYEFSETEAREVENHYPTMPVEEIEALKVPAAKNAVLFLWATAPKLREALQVMQSWGFEYKTHMIWDKDMIGMGYWTRGQHELLLVGVKGQYAVPEPQNRESSVYKERRTEHSAKPEYYYGLIERLCPNGTYLELFARTNRENWKAWGLDVQN